MGDGLPEKLYTAWRASQPDPTEHPSWGNADTDTRRAWEAVAIVARGDAAAKQNDEIAMLREANAAWQRRCGELTAARVVEIDQGNCPHNTAIEPDTGKCLTCGAILP